MMNKLGFLIYATNAPQIKQACDFYLDAISGEKKLPPPKKGSSPYQFLVKNNFLTDKGELIDNDENIQKISIIREIVDAGQNKQTIMSITGGCIVCHQNDPDQIEFHHVDAAGNFGEHWAKNPNMTKDKSTVAKEGWKEVIKCVPLCKSCHQKVTNGDILPPELVMQYFNGPGEKIAEFLSADSENWKIESFDEEVRLIAHQYIPQEGTDEWEDYQKERKEQFDFVLGTSLFQTKLFMEELNKRKEEYTRIAESGTGNAKIEATEGLSRIHRMQKDLQAETLFRAKTYIYGMENLEEEDKKNLFNMYDAETQTALYGPQENNFNIPVDSMDSDIPVDSMETEWSNTKGQSSRIERLEKLRERLIETLQQLMSIQQQISELSGQEVVKSSKNKFKQIVKLQNLEQQEENLIEEIEALEEEITNETEILNQEIQEISQSNQEVQQQSEEVIMPQEQAAESSPEEMMAMLQQNPGQASMGQEMPIDPSQMQAPPQPTPPTPEELAQLKKQRTKEKEDAPLSNLDPDEQQMAQELAMAAQAQAAAGAPPGGPPPPPTSNVKKSHSIHDELKNNL